MQTKEFLLGTATGFVISAASFGLAWHWSARNDTPPPVYNLTAAPAPTKVLKEFNARSYVTDCQDDVQKLCPGKAFGRGAGACLLSAKDQVGEICRARLAEIEADYQKSLHDRPYLKSCKVDLEKFCPGKNFGSGAGGCLLENRDKLSSGCIKHLPDLEKDRLENP